MTFIRSRVMFALIGLLVVGGISAAIAMMTTSQSLHAAVAGAGQANGSNTGGGAASIVTATATTSSTATATTAPTTNTTAPGGQLLDLHGQVASVNISGGTFKLTDGTTVVVTAATAFQGDAHTLAQLKSGWKVEVKGSTQANGSFLATSVNADSGA